jgi:hypothetical protein
VSSSNRHVVLVRPVLGTVFLGLASVLPVLVSKERRQEVVPICSLSRTLVLDCPGCCLLTKQEMKEVTPARQPNLIG